ncbi:MAG TPA: protein phosphatase 2C domain-containing protein, partial [Dehalococcoidia bacterium]|nr:protein phosphatase 2C domain-containing protein [Dehalococcoidia bacterium]
MTRATLTKPVVEAGLRYDCGREWSACTLTGPGKPINADALALDFTGNCLAFVVADGVGAMAGSQMASALAANAAADWIASRSWLDRDAITSLYAAANRAVGAGLKDKNTSGATTMVLAAVAGGQGLVASVGDSEILAVEMNGPAKSLAPVDHLPKQTNVLLAWLDGVETFDANVIALEALPYRLCLMTDGVAGTLSYETIADLVRSVEPAEAARLLVREARAAGSKDDATA